MLNSKIKSLTDLSGLLAKVEAEFEKKSGWKPKDVKATLENFSRLAPGNKAMFAGLLVGNAILKKPAVATAKPRAKRAPKAAPEATASI